MDQTTSGPATSPRAVTQADIERLRADPSKAAKFDSFFGQGASAQYLAVAAEPPPSEAVAAPVEPPAQEPGTLPEEDLPGNMVTRAIGGIGRALGFGVQEAANEAVDTAKSIDEGASTLLDKVGIPSRLQILDKEGNFSPDLKYQYEVEAENAPNSLFGGAPGEEAPDIEIVREPVSELGKATAGFTQFMAGFAGARALTGVGGMVGSFLNGAISDAAVFDPADENLSNLMESTGYAAPILTEALAVDPESPEWVNRMRRAAEGVIVGGALETTLKGLRAISLARKARETGDPGLAKQAQDMADEVEVQAQRDLDEGVDPNGDRLTAPESPVEGTPDAAATSAPGAPFVNPQALSKAIADKAEISVNDLSDASWINLSKMDGPVEAQHAIRAVADELERSGAMAKLGTDRPETFGNIVSFAKRELAEITGQGIEGFSKRLEGLSEVAGDQAKMLVASKMVLQSTGREIAGIAKKLQADYALGRVTPEDEAKLLDLVETHSGIQSHLKVVQQAAARATAAGRIRTGAGLDKDAVDALTRVGQMGGSPAVRKFVDQLGAAGNDAAAQAALIRAAKRGGVGKRIMSVANEVFINSILSGWHTHAVNMASNAISIGLLPFERAVGGALTGSRQQTEAGIRQLYYMRSAMMDAARMAGRVLRTENPVLDNAVKLEYQHVGKAISAESFGVARDSGPGKVIEGVGHFIRLPGRLLMAEDELFKQMMFRSRLQSELAATASSMQPDHLKTLGYSSRGEFLQGEMEKAVFSVQTLSDKWDELVQAGKVSVDDAEAREAFIRTNIGAANEASPYAKEALRSAREATFTTPLPENSLSGGYQQLANRHPVIRQITPFIQTPVNILNKAFDRVPGVNMLRSRYRDRLASPDPAIRAEAAGEMATGVAISSALFFLAHEGRITGGGPADASKRAIWTRDRNWQPYSINIGSAEEPHWVEYKRMDPYAFTFGVAGDIVEMAQAAQDDPSFDGASAFAMLAAAVGNNLTSKTWLQGIADFVEVLNSKDRPWVAQRFLEDRAAAFVPMSGFSRSVNTDSAEYQKEARGYLDKIKMATPGLGADLPDRYDWVTGQPIEKVEQVLGFVKVKKGGGDPVSVEMRRLNYGFAGPDRKVEQITLSTEQFQEWNRLTGTVKIGGLTLHERLARTIASDQYDADRKRIPDGIDTPAENPRVKMLGKIVSAYKRRARAELLENDPSLKSAYRDFKVYQQKALTGRASPADRKSLVLGF